MVDAGAGDAEIDLAERTVPAGCAVQNMLLMATAQGYGSALTSGKALKAPSLRALFQLAASEQALCFISIGTVLSRKAGVHARRPVPCEHGAGKLSGRCPVLRCAWWPQPFIDCETLHGYFQF